MRRKIDKIDGFNYERGYIYDFQYELVWTTQYRKALFVNNDLIQAMQSILYKLAKQNEIVINTLEIRPAFVHLQLSFKPKKAPTDVVKTLKGGSAYLLFKAYPSLKQDSKWQHHLWASNYLMSTTGQLSGDSIKRYVQNQYSK